PFYWQGFEPTQGRPQYAPVDRQVAWLRQAGIVPKGHPLVWFHDVSVPDWLRDLPYAEVKSLVQRRVRQVTQRYGSHIPYYDVINEAHHVPWANALNFSADQFLELTQVACEAARQGHPQVNRIVNSCCLWAQNVAYNGPPQRSPYRYLQACLAAGIEFETIGLQLYYPDQDMFEIDRLLDRFAGLGKPLHITEMATSSGSGVDEQSQLQDVRGLWHAPWSETIQADWVEQIYTLGYSKPEVQAITWWDFSDLGVFWPFGGLLNRDLQPKAAFERLRHLLQSWEVPHLA
ncbi:MAG: endo-1,4-beta-xylanase, partial [Cyanobacteria bacterium Co-bin13]|nr:endo-1,4-beta-xylanase [Cyanobacteria bacterium Co-bin13]